MAAVRARTGESFSCRLKSLGEAVRLHLGFSLNSKGTGLLPIFIRNIILSCSLPALYSEALLRSKIRFKDQTCNSLDVLHNLIVSICKYCQMVYKHQNHRQNLCSIREPSSRESLLFPPLESPLFSMQLNDRSNIF